MKRILKFIKKDGFIKLSKTKYMSKKKRKQINKLLLKNEILLSDIKSFIHLRKDNKKQFKINYIDPETLISFLKNFNRPLYVIDEAHQYLKDMSLSMLKICGCTDSGKTFHSIQSNIDIGYNTFDKITLENNDSKL